MVADIKIPTLTTVPHTLIGLPLGLLLVFRTNSAYVRANNTRGFHLSFYHSIERPHGCPSQFCFITARARQGDHFSHLLFARPCLNGLTCFQHSSQIRSFLGGPQGVGHHHHCCASLFALRWHIFAENAIGRYVSACVRRVLLSVRLFGDPSCLLSPPFCPFAGGLHELLLHTHLNSSALSLKLRVSVSEASRCYHAIQCPVVFSRCLSSRIASVPPIRPSPHPPSVSPPSRLRSSTVCVALAGRAKNLPIYRARCCPRRWPWCSRSTIGRPRVCA